MAQKPSQRQLDQRARGFEKKADQRRQSSDKLRESEARFRALFESGPEAMVVIDAESGKFVDAKLKKFVYPNLGPGSRYTINQDCESPNWKVHFTVYPCPYR
jgi:hypothetical protein